MKRILLRLGLPIFAVVALVFLLQLGFSYLMPSDQFIPERMEFSLDENVWESVALPHDWRSLSAKENQRLQRQIVYRVKLPHLDNAGMFIPAVNSYLSVWLDGRLIHEEVLLTKVSNNRWNHPRWLELGSINQDQTLVLKVVTDQPGYGLLSRVFVAERDFLYPYFQQWQWVHLTLLEYFSVGVLLIAIFLLAIWFSRRVDSVFGFAAAFMLMWFFHNLQLFITDLPVPRVFVDWYAKGTLCWLVIFIILFIHRLLGAPPKRFERGLIFYGVISSLVTFVLAFFIPETYWQVTSLYWDNLTLLAGVYPTLRVARATLERTDLTIVAVAATGILIEVFALHDWMQVNLGFSREYGYLIHYSSIVAVVSFGLILLQGFTRALSTAESANVELEKQVAQVSESLEQRYQDMQALRKEQTLAEERERIMRDMHDGIGGHLVSCIAILEADPNNTEAIAGILRASLQDLRLMIDSLEPTQKDLSTILAMLRERTETNLNLVGIAYRWQVTDVGDDMVFPPDVTLQLLRIFQEAITNIIKHAEAKNIAISTQETVLSQQKFALVTISDDGRGFDISKVQDKGHGIRNMKARARRIGADVGIITNSLGTQLQVSVPLERY